MSLEPQRHSMSGYAAQHFLWRVQGKAATLTLNRPERKNPLTFAAYAEPRDLFRALAYADDIKSVVVTGAGGNFCSGGDVHEIIGPLTRLGMPELLAFTRMTGDLVKAMRARPQPIVAAIDGVCAGAGAMIALASDLRCGTARSQTAFLFSRVGLAGCDMGACTLLPRTIEVIAPHPLARLRFEQCRVPAANLIGTPGGGFKVAIAKLFATESAQQVIDAAVQMFGGRGVVKGEIVESLYREIRALRIYEGASKVQKLIIAREILQQPRANPS